VGTTLKYISLLVHERPDVIAGQLLNFSMFFPDAVVVLHVSLGAGLSGKSLESYLHAAGLRNFRINPVSVKTDWGGIISAHLQNIAFIRACGDASVIVFHSSNDMLVKDGVGRLISDAVNVFNWRRVYPGGCWWPGQVALQDDVFIKAVSSYGSGLIVASQIEGSAYDANLLFDICDEISSLKLLDSPLFYPREELFFSTFSACRGVFPSAVPYIYSEVHVFDRSLWRCIDRLSPVLSRDSDWSRRLREALNKAMFNSRFYKITMENIDEVRRSDARLAAGQYLDDGNEVWRIYDPAHLYGVKRIERDSDDPVRKYILNEVMQ
jgi:hypothetical protein